MTTNGVRVCYYVLESLKDSRLLSASVDAIRNL